jgi:hypothetical protein
MGSEGDITPYLLSRLLRCQAPFHPLRAHLNCLCRRWRYRPVVQRSPEYLAWRHAAWRALRESHATVVIPLAIAEAFIVSEGKEAVFANRAACRNSKLILLQRLDCGRKVIACVESVVAEEFVDSAMNVISARASDHARG